MTIEKQHQIPHIPPIIQQKTVLKIKLEALTDLCKKKQSMHFPIKPFMLAII